MSDAIPPAEPVAGPTGDGTVTRRGFLGRSARAALGVAVAGGTYSVLEAKWCHAVETTLTVRRLPPSFRGLRVALLSDVHHGCWVPAAYVRAVVNLTLEAKPDLIVMAGDYVYGGKVNVAGGMSELARLDAPLGKFAAFGNHDMWHGCFPNTMTGLQTGGFQVLLNHGVWLERGGERLRLCGVGDLWTHVQNPQAAIGDATSRDAVVMLSHNPDYAEKLQDDRVSLMLSGHTHGGQVRLPGVGPLVLPSRYGKKYGGGLAFGPVCPVFVSRGVGTVGPPVRFLDRPEVNLITFA